MTAVKRSLEIRVHVPWIYPSRRDWVWGLAVFFILALAENPATESVTLTTYYPAPAGAYNNMVTIGDTWLARDGQSFVEIGDMNSPPSGTKLGVAQGSVRLTSAWQDSNSNDHWIGTDASPGSNLVLNGKAGGGVDVGVGNVPAFNVGFNQQTQFYNYASIGPYPADPGSSTNPYFHVNSNSCVLYGPGNATCHGPNGSGYGADNCTCPSGYYATWDPGIYVETGSTSFGWYHERYDWGIWASNVQYPSGAYFDAGGSGATWGSVQLQIQTQQFGNVTVLVPGRNYLAATSQPVNDGYGDQYFYCCPK